MLTQKTLITLIILGFFVSPAAGDIRFDDPDNISFYTGLNFEGNNQIYGLAEPTASDSPVRKQDISSNYYNLSGDTLKGPLNADGYNINNFFDNSCGPNQAVKEIYDNGSVRCGEAGGNSGLPEVLNNNESLNQNIDGNGYQITNLSAPIGSKSPLRQQDLGDYVNRTGDTLAGNISFNNQYYLTDLKDPVNAQDAATKSYVQNYADDNDDTISDDQDLSVGTDPSGGGSTTIDITNGSSATFTDDYAADNQNLGYNNKNAPTSDYAQHQITINNGTNINIRDYYDTNTDKQIDETGASANVELNDYNLDMGGGFIERGALKTSGWQGNSRGLTNSFLAAAEKKWAKSSNPSGISLSTALNPAPGTSKIQDSELPATYTLDLPNSRDITSFGIEYTWAPQDTEIEIYDGSSWTSIHSSTDGRDIIFKQTGGNFVDGGARKIRLSFDGTTGGHDRILINSIYATVRYGQRGAFISRKGDEVYGNLDMNSNNVTDTQCLGDQC